MKEANLNEIAQKAVRSLLPLDGRIRVKVEFVPEPLAIMADKARMEEAVTILIKSGAEAMPDGGVLTISTKLVGSQTNGRSLPVSSCALISVADTGVGMDRVRMEGLFGPRRVEGGSRLSLAHSIIVRHSGCFEIESDPGKGTMIKIYLPMITGGGGKSMGPLHPGRPSVEN